MQLPVLIPILIHTITLAIAILALVVARGAHNTSPAKVVQELLDMLENWEVRQDRLEGKWKKLNANYASLRAEMKQAPESPEPESEEDDVDTRMRPGETPQDWKSRMRRAMHNGRLKHRSE